MSVIAEFSIPTNEFALRETLEQYPDLTFEVDRVVAHDAEHVLPFVWVANRGIEELTSVLEADPSVEQVELLTEVDNERFYRLEWTSEARVVGHMVIEHDAIIQRATATDGVWTVRVLFPARSGISETYEFAQSHGLTLTLKELYDVDNTRRVRFNLTDSQHETRVEGYERGYYDIPREADQSDLANALDISHQALSERLRRGAKNLIENVLIVDEDKN